MNRIDRPRKISERLRSDPRLVGSYRRARQTHFLGEIPALLGSERPLWLDEAPPVHLRRRRYAPLPSYTRPMPRSKRFALTVPSGFVAHFDQLDAALAVGLLKSPEHFSINQLRAELEVAELPRLFIRGGTYCVNPIDDDFFAEIHWGRSFPRAKNHERLDPPLPNTAPGRFLVDWSASHSLISSRIARHLELRRIWTLPVVCAGEEQIRLVNQFDASALVLGPVRESGAIFPALSILAADLNDWHVDGVIGRDLLLELPWASKLLRPLSERQLQHEFAYSFVSPSIKWP